MNIEIHQIGDHKIAEIRAEEILVHNPGEGLQLLVDLYYQDFDKIIIHEKNITPDFFDLKTGIAGEILQKFSNYRVRLVIVGEFIRFPVKASKISFLKAIKADRSISLIQLNLE